LFFRINKNEDHVFLIEIFLHFDFYKFFIGRKLCLCKLIAGSVSFWKEILATMHLLAKVVSLAALIVTTAAAKADSLDSFNLTYQGNTISWILPSNPTADSSTPHFAVFDNVPVYYDGMPEVATYIEFPTTLIGGGIVVNINNENPYIYAGGPQLIAGDTSLPVFLRNEFFLDDDATILITPELSTFVLFGSGVLCLAGVARRRFLSV
jgi:hypothetical protein